MKIEINYNGKTVPINIYENDVISNDIIRNKTFYEIKFLDFISTNFNKNKTIIDIGANIGNHSLFFSEYLEHERIHCFELHPDNVDLLTLNMKDKKCIIHEIALSDTEGNAIMYNSEIGNNGGFSLNKYESSYVVNGSIKTRTLDSYKINNVTMIKIDAEAHELSILIGSKETILKNKPVIFVEDLFHGCPHLFTENRFDGFFKEVGYYKKYENIHNSLMDCWLPIN